MFKRDFGWRRDEVGVLLAGLVGLGAALGYACGDDDSGTTADAGQTPAGETDGSAPVTSDGAVISASCVSDAATSGNTAAVVSAANALLATLTSEQRTAIRYERTLANAIQWSNFPAGVVQRNGVKLGDLSDTAKSAAETLVEIAAGTTGAALLDEARSADDAYAGIAGNTALFGKGNYYVSFHGMPSVSSSFMLQLAGHHMAYNFTYGGKCTSATPLFDGVQPALWTDAEGKAHDPLAAQRSAMAKLFASTGTGAQLSGSFSDMINGPAAMGGGTGGAGATGAGGMTGPGGAGRDAGAMMAPAGAGTGGAGGGGGTDSNYPTGLTYPTSARGQSVAALSAEQKALVKIAIETWVNNVASPIATSLLAIYESDEALAQTYVGYAGSADMSTTYSYARIDGPRVWIELTVQEGTDAGKQGHYHTIWRDKVSDYGADFLSQ